MALGTPKIDYIVGTSGPVREDRVSGCPSGDNLSQETCVPRVWIKSFSFWMAVIRLSDSAERHKPAKDPSTTTDDQVTRDSAGRSNPVA